MICKKCGAEYPDDAAKCPVCEAETMAEVEEKAEQESVAENTLDISAEDSAPIIEQPAEIAEGVPVEDIVPAGKSKKPIWIASIAAAVIIIAAIIFAVASNLTFTGAASDKATVYTVERKEKTRVYAKVGDGKEQFIKTLDENEKFSEKKDFIVKNNNIYFLNDDDGLSIMNIKNGKTKVIGENFKPGTIIISAKGNAILFADDDGMLYKSTRGGKAKEVADIGKTAFEASIPNYGFVEGTNNVWYAPIENDAVTGTVCLESGDAIAEKASAVFYVGKKGKDYTVVYTALTDEKTVQPEPAEPKEGEEAQTPEPIIERTYALMVKEGKKDPVVLNDNYVNTDSVSILHKEHKGVVYLADKGEPEKDEETGEIVGVAKGTLYFYEFGGKKTVLDKDVTVSLLLDELRGTNYFFDASARVKDETIAYMKDDKIAIIKDLKPVENPADFEFLSSTPVFDHNNTFILYKTYNPTPVTENTGENAEENKEPEKTPTKLVYSNLVNGKWQDYTVVAENAVDYNYDSDNGKIYYMTNESEEQNKRTLYCYTMKDKKSVKIADDVLGYVTFSNEGKNLYFINGFDSETQLASLSYYDGKKATVLAKNLGGCFIAEDGVPYIVIPDGENNDLYVVEGTKINLVCKKMTNILYAR